MLVPELDNNSLLNLFWENYEQYYEPIYARFDFRPLKKYENTIWRYKNRRDNIQEFVDAIFGTQSHFLTRSHTARHRRLLLSLQAPQQRHWRRISIEKDDCKGVRHQ